MRTLLVLDVGNTRVKVGLVVGGHIEARLQIDTECIQDVASLTMQLRTTFAEWATIDACLIASVVRDASEPIGAAIQNIWSVSPIVVNTQHDLGIVIAVPKPEWVGIDRLLEASEAHHLLGTGVVVATLGSAITVDLVTDGGTFLGGTILPGLRTGLQALHNETSLLPQLEVEAPHTVLGKDTAACMQAGVVYGAAGAVDRIYQELCDVAGKHLSLVITGGDVKYVASLLKAPHQIEADLVLRALIALDKRRTQKNR